MRVIEIDAQALGTVMLREAPMESTQVGDNGEAIRYGRVVMPSMAGGVDLRLRANRPYQGAPGPVRLTGTVRITAWYQAQGRGRSASSEVTITADGIEPSDGELTLFGRDIPVLCPAGVIYIGPAGNRVQVMLPADIYSRDGGVFSVAPIVGDRLPVADGIRGGVDEVRLVGLTVRGRNVDQADAGRFAKSELLFFAQRVEKAPAARQSTPPKADPKPDVKPEVAA